MMWCPDVKHSLTRRETSSLPSTGDLTYTFPLAGMRGIGECWDGAGANCLTVWPVARAVLGRGLNESLTRCSWTGRQAGSNAAQRILKALETESRPHAGTYIVASTTKRPTIKQTTALVTSEAHGQSSAQDSSDRVCM